MMLCCVGTPVRASSRKIDWSRARKSTWNRRWNRCRGACAKRLTNGSGAWHKRLYIVIVERRAKIFEQQRRLARSERCPRNVRPDRAALRSGEPSPQRGRGFFMATARGENRPRLATAVGARSGDGKRRSRARDSASTAGSNDHGRGFLAGDVERGAKERRA